MCFWPWGEAARCMRGLSSSAILRPSLRCSTWCSCCSVLASSPLLTRCRQPSEVHAKLATTFTATCTRVTLPVAAADAGQAVLDADVAGFSQHAAAYISSMRLPTEWPLSSLSGQSPLLLQSVTTALCCQGLTAAISCTDMAQVYAGGSVKATATCSGMACAQSRLALASRCGWASKQAMEMQSRCAQPCTLTDLMTHDWSPL